MRRWGRLTHWIVTEQGEELLVEITDFDEGKALELVRAQPTSWRTNETRSNG
jgi:hypothetical protein